MIPVIYYPVTVAMCHRPRRDLGSAGSLGRGAASGRCTIMDKPSGAANMCVTEASRPHDPPVLFLSPLKVAKTTEYVLQGCLPVRDLPTFR